MKNINKLICGLGVAVLGLATFTSCEEETQPTSYATVDQMAQSSSATEALLSAIPASLNSHASKNKRRLFLGLWITDEDT